MDFLPLFMVSSLLAAPVPAAAERHALAADLLCTGRPVRVIVTRDARNGRLSVPRTTGLPSALALDFPLYGQPSDALQVMSEPVAAPSGKKACQGVAIRHGETDAIHVLYDAKRRKLVWWSN